MVHNSPISLKLLGFQQTPRAALVNTYTVSLAFLGNISHSVKPVLVQATEDAL